MPSYDSLKDSDPAVYAALMGEMERQRDGVELIASENYASPSVLEALGSVFTNKYSEGYPGKRYYGGQEFTDKVETLAIERAKTIFRCDHANVQPLSGAAANVAAYLAWMEPGDSIMGMDLSHGGHLTHGSPVTHMAKLFRFIRYKMKDTETGAIDFDALRETARKEKPKIILTGFTAYPRNVDYSIFKSIADEVGAVTMADMAHVAGLIAGGVVSNPFDAGFHIMTTTTHKSLRGPRGAMILSRGIVGNPLKATEKKVENLPTLIDRSVFPGLQGGPHMHQTAAIAVALGEAMQPTFKTYAAQILKNAKALAAYLMNNGCKLVTNGTDNHLMIVDCMKSFGRNGKEIERILDTVGITASKSPIPDDPNPPFSPSGLRLGTPAITTRGMKEGDVETLGAFMLKAIHERETPSTLAALKQEVTAFCRGFPVPGIQESVLEK
jgi:glycine hydroxymethyltransferase